MKATHICYTPQPNPFYKAKRLPTASGTTCPLNADSKAAVARHPVQCPGAKSCSPNFRMSAIAIFFTWKRNQLLRRSITFISFQLFRVLNRGSHQRLSTSSCLGTSTYPRFIGLAHKTSPFRTGMQARKAQPSLL